LEHGEPLRKIVQPQYYMALVLANYLETLACNGLTERARRECVDGVQLGPLGGFVYGPWLRYYLIRESYDHCGLKP
jgi:hypothetical protein